MLDLLLDEDEYQYILEEVRKFAEKENIEFSSSTSVQMLTVITTMIVVENLDTKTIATLQKLVYNIGYRDNIFSPRYLH